MANSTSAAAAADPSSSASDAATDTAARRRKLAHHTCPTQPSLIPGLPDHVAHLCLSRVNPSFLYSVCRSWRRLLYSPSFPPFLSLYALLSPDELPRPPPAPGGHGNCLSRIEFAAFDPVASQWRPLPPPLRDQPFSILLRHPSFLSRNFPIQSVSVSGNLVILAATAYNFFPAIPCPLVFNPLTGDWSTGPPLSVPRRWCAAGASRGAVYVASGVGSSFITDVAKSVEKWDFSFSCNNRRRSRSPDQIWKWQKLRELKDMVKFSRDAIEAVGWRGKLCMVNVKGGAFREGIVYDVADDTWSEMPKGMIDGWRGPAAAMDESELFAIDEASGALRRYDSGRDAWDDVIVSDDLRGAQQVAAAGGRVCAVSGRGSQIVVADVVSVPPRTWVIETPNGSRAVAVHILPRTNWPDS